MQTKTVTLNSMDRGGDKQEIYLPMIDDKNNNKLIIRDPHHTIFVSKDKINNIEKPDKTGTYNTIDTTSKKTKAENLKATKR